MKAKPIVILGPSFGEYPQMVAKGFHQNGLEAHCFCYPEPAVGLLEVLTWEYLPRLHLSTCRQVAMDRLLRRVDKACKDAEFLLIIKGDSIPIHRYTATLDHIKCPKVLWLMDSLHRIRDGIERASTADVVLSFEGGDAQALDGLPAPHHVVALAVDSDRYFPLRSSGRRRDLSFAGALYPNRLSTLESILAAMPSELRVEARFVANYRSRLHPSRTREICRRYPLAAAYLEQRSNWPHDIANRLYNESKICLNIFHPQSVDSVNPRTFEICCSGAFQLSQLNRAIGRYLKLGQEVEVFDSAEEAAEKITYYLGNDTAAERIAAAGRERVLAEHTFKVRVGQIMETLKREL